MIYKFIYDNKEYTLDKANLNSFFNDEVNPISDINEDNILDMLCNGRNVQFSKQFYSLPCEECRTENSEKKKAYDFLEFHFYVYTKDNKVVISNIDENYIDWDYERLNSIGKIDNSYIVSIIVCKECGTYDIEIEELEM